MLKTESFDISEFLQICKLLELKAFSQDYALCAKGQAVENDGVLIFIDDEKYNYKTIAVSDFWLDEVVSNEGISFNSFLIPLKFVDAIKINYQSQNLRFRPFEREGLFYSNSVFNEDILTFSKMITLSEKSIVDFKNSNFLNEEQLQKLLKNVAMVIDFDDKTAIKNYRNSKRLFFAKQENESFDRELISSCANDMVGLKIVKDNQNSTFDCASFVSYLYMSELGIDILHGGIGNSSTGKIMSSDIGESLLVYESLDIKSKIQFIKKHAKVGDILLFHRQSRNSCEVESDNWFPGHVGVYVGDGKYIDARHRRGDVSLVDMNDDEYMNCFIGVKNFISEKYKEKEQNEVKEKM